MGMSVNEAHAQGTPESVWAIISQPSLYGDWVVGAEKVLEADDSWPAEGSSLKHQSSVGPLNVEDVTTVLVASAPNHIELDAHLGPIGKAKVVMDFISEASGGTKIVMQETFDEGIASKAPGITDALLKGRNVETLRRLVDLSEGKR